jgi:hypothetical protein
LRVTYVYWREDGQWRIVHRHADIPPAAFVPGFPDTVILSQFRRQVCKELSCSRWVAPEA